MVFPSHWYFTLRGFNYPNKIWAQKVLFLFSCLLFIPVRIIIASPAGEDVQPLCQGGVSLCQEDILLLHALSGKDM